MTTRPTKREERLEKARNMFSEPLPADAEKPTPGRTALSTNAQFATLQARIATLESEAEAKDAELQTLENLRAAYPDLESLLKEGLREEELLAQKGIKLGPEVALDIGSVRSNPNQVRQKIDNEAVERLAEGIKARGLINPITVRRMDDGVYRIVCGEMRYRAHILMGASFIQAKVADIDDETERLWNLTENLLRTDPTDFETAVYISKNFEGVSPTDLAITSGISRTRIYQFRAFMELPSFVLDSLEEDQTLLGCNSAYELSRFISKSENPEAAVAALKEIWPNYVSTRYPQERLLQKTNQALRGASGSKSRVVKLVELDGVQVGELRYNSALSSISNRLSSKDVPRDKMEKFLEAISKAYEELGCDLI